MINADLATLAAGLHFSVEAVDCRNTTCSVELKWPSQAQAVEEYRHLVTHSYRANCSKSLVVREPAQADGSAKALMLLDCEEWRADGEPESGERRPPGTP
jgi:hypothetical protein